MNSAPSSPHDFAPGDSGLPGGTHHASRLVERQAVLIGMMLDNGQARWLPGRVTDISTEGCRLLLASGDLAAGMAVQIMLPGFAGRGATVMWVDGGQAGCRFDTALHAAILDYIIRMSDPVARG